MAETPDFGVCEGIKATCGLTQSLEILVKTHDKGRCLAMQSIETLELLAFERYGQK